MDYLEELDSGTIERLGAQHGFLLSTYYAELARDPTSRAAESSRSHVIALWHTIRQIYGKAVAREVANLVYTNTKLLPATQVGVQTQFGSCKSRQSLELQQVKRLARLISFRGLGALPEMPVLIQSFRCSHTLMIWVRPMDLSIVSTWLV
jgi:hypothetical protein